MSEFYIRPEDVPGQPVTYHNESIAYRVADTIHPYGSEGYDVNDDINAARRISQRREKLDPTATTLHQSGYRAIPENELHQLLAKIRENYRRAINYNIDQWAALYLVEERLTEDGLLKPETPDKLKDALMEEYKQKLRIEKYTALLEEDPSNPYFPDIIESYQSMYERAQRKRQKRERKINWMASLTTGAS